MILDSGERVNFDSGAVRDIKSGKGRCDLMPLEEVADVLAQEVAMGVRERLSTWVGDIIGNVNKFRETHMNAYASFAIITMADHYCPVTFDAVPMPQVILDVSHHFEEGALKYGEWNWTKGIPFHSYIDSAVRHLLKHAIRETDESHHRAFVWNMLCAMWSVNNMAELEVLSYNKGYEVKVQDVRDGVHEVCDKSADAVSTIIGEG